MGCRGFACGAGCRGVGSELEAAAAEGVAVGCTHNADLVLCILSLHAIVCIRLPSASRLGARPAGIVRLVGIYMVHCKGSGVAFCMHWAGVASSTCILRSVGASRTGLGAAALMGGLFTRGGQEGWGARGDAHVARHRSVLVGRCGGLPDHGWAAVWRRRARFSFDSMACMHGARPCYCEPWGFSGRSVCSPGEQAHRRREPPIAPIALPSM